MRYVYRILFDFGTFVRAAYCPDIYYTPAILSKLNFCIHIAYRFCSYHVCTAYADHIHIYNIYSKVQCLDELEHSISVNISVTRPFSANTAKLSNLGITPRLYIHTHRDIYIYILIKLYWIVYNF